MHKNISIMMRKAINCKPEPNPRTNNVTLAYWKQRLLVTNMKGVAMRILAQYPTCRNPSCIHRIETHRYNFLRIGSDTSHTSNAYLHCLNDIEQQPPSDTSTIDSVPIFTDNLSLAQPISNPLGSTKNQASYNTQRNQSFSFSCPNYPLPNNPFRYFIYHTNLSGPTNPPMAPSLPSSPNMAA